MSLFTPGKIAIIIGIVVAYFVITKMMKRRR